MSGCIYIASMENVVGRLKIGWTTRGPDERIPEWGGDTGAPTHEFAAYVNADQSLETRIHNSLKKYRVRPRADWFKIGLATAVKTVRDIGGSAIFEEFDRKNTIAEAKRIKSREEAEARRIRKKEETEERKRKIKSDQNKCDEKRIDRKAWQMAKPQIVTEDSRSYTVAVTIGVIVGRIVIVLTNIALFLLLIPAAFIYRKYRDAERAKFNDPIVKDCIEDVKLAEARTTPLNKTLVSCLDRDQENYVPAGKFGLATFGTCGYQFYVVG